MGNFFIIAAILLPIISGFGLLQLKIKNEQTIQLYSEYFVIAASLAVWLGILNGPHKLFTLYNFSKGFSIDFYMDPLSMLFAGMVSIMWPFVLLYAFEYMKGEKELKGFIAFFIMTYGITLGIALSGNILTLYVFFEMLSLVTIPLVSFYQDHDSMYAGRYYACFVIGGAALAFIAVVVTTVNAGGVFVYGGYRMDGLSDKFLNVVYLLAFFGFGVKAAVFPFHSWLPIASVAPTPVTALLHAVAVVNSGVYAIIRVSYYIFSTDFLHGSGAQYAAMSAVLFTIIYAAGKALKERHFKRRLAYSTISNLSYMLFGIVLFTKAGMIAGMAHMLFHGIIKMSLFLCAGAFMHVTGKNYVFEINGIAKKMPLTFTLYTVGALSLTGVPLFCGFISKWKLFTAGAADGSVFGIVGIICLILAAFLCAIYTLTVSIRAFFPVSGTDFNYGREIHDPGVYMLIPIIFFTAANIILGIFPQLIIGFLDYVAGGI